MTDVPCIWIYTLKIQCLSCKYTFNFCMFEGSVLSYSLFSFTRWQHYACIRYRNPITGGAWADPDGGSGAQGARARAPSKPVADRSGRIGSVLLALPLRFQNALKDAWNRTKLHIHCVPEKVSPLNILQQQPQICNDLNEILHTQDHIYFCHRRQIS